MEKSPLPFDLSYTVAIGVAKTYLRADRRVKYAPVSMTPREIAMADTRFVLSRRLLEDYRNYRLTPPLLLRRLVDTLSDSVSRHIPKRYSEPEIDPQA